MNKDQLKELEQLAQPLIEYLKSNYDPYTAIVVTDERVSMVNTVASMPIK